MRTIRIIAVALVLSSVGLIVLAQDRPRPSVIRDVLVGHPQEGLQGVKAAPAPGPAPKTRYARVAAQATPGTDQKQHLLQAIGHLEAAGFKEEATRLRDELSRLELAELELQKQRKSAELHELEARIQHLRSQSWADRVVTIRMSMVEIPHEWLEAMLADLRPNNRLEPIPKASSAAAVSIIIDDGESVERLISVLSQQEVVTVVARPTVKTLHGNAATVAVGGESPRVIPAGGNIPQIATESFGLKMTALPTILDDKRIRLQLQCERWDRDGDSDSVKSTRIQTMVEMKNGQTLLLVRPNSKGGHDLLTVIKPEVNDLSNGVPTAAKPRVESPYTAIPLSPPRLEPVPEPIPETAELPAPATILR